MPVPVELCQVDGILEKNAIRENRQFRNTKPTPASITARSMGIREVQDTVPSLITDLQSGLSFQKERQELAQLQLWYLLILVAFPTFLHRLLLSGKVSYKN